MTEIIASSLAVLQITALGVKIKDLVPEMIKIGFIKYMRLKKDKVIKKMSKVMITYIFGEYHHKKKLNEMIKKLKSLFKRFTTIEIYKKYKFYKNMKELFYKVDFNDNYFKKNCDKLIVDELAMKNYLIKKLYIQHIYQVILVKLYNNLISVEKQKMILNDLIDIFMIEAISYQDLENVLELLTNQMRDQYKEQAERYEKDFIDEKNYLTNIFIKITNNSLPRKLKTTLLEVVDLLKDTNNVDLDAPSMKEQLIADAKEKYGHISEENLMERINNLRK